VSRPLPATKTLMLLVAVLLRSVPVEAEHHAEPSLIGSWTVTRVAAMAPVTALTQAESQEFVGAVLRYGVTEFSNGLHTFTIKAYASRKMSNEEFFTEAHLPARKLRITGPNVVEISAEGSQRDLGDEFGSDVFIVDRGMVMVAYRGVYFQARRRHQSP
jgi:hypothetical protein